jgi:hypothetical protein
MFGEFLFPFFEREPDVWQVPVRNQKAGTRQKSGFRFRSGKSDPRPHFVLRKFKKMIPSAVL